MHEFGLRVSVHIYLISTAWEVCTGVCTLYTQCKKRGEKTADLVSFSTTIVARSGAQQGSGCVSEVPSKHTFTLVTSSVLGR